MPATKKNAKSTPNAPYPKHSIKKALRIPAAILEQNAGKACTVAEAAKFCKLGNHGPFAVEVSSSLKYGLLSRPESGKIQPTDLAKRIIRPQSSDDEVAGLREAVLQAPILKDLYRYYRGENIPDDQFLYNTLIDSFQVSSERAPELKVVFLDSLRDAQLLEDSAGKLRVLDVASSEPNDHSGPDDKKLKKIAKSLHLNADDSCFVMMPFADPIGSYYKSVYEPAIVKAGLRPVRADTDIFATGKIMDQVWSGIQAAKVLVAELTGRNPNVFYELGLAHALEKPVVLVSSNQDDVPFDLQHIRVIYYDMKDPFWGEKLIAKVSENILSALTNPSEAVFLRNASQR